MAHMKISGPEIKALIIDTLWELHSGKTTTVESFGISTIFVYRGVSDWTSWWSFLDVIKN